MSYTNRVSIGWWLPVIVIKEESETATRSIAGAARSSMARDRAARGSPEHSPAPQPYSLCHKQVTHSLRKALSFSHTPPPRGLFQESWSQKHQLGSTLQFPSYLLSVIPTCLYANTILQCFQVPTPSLSSSLYLILISLLNSSKMFALIFPNKIIISSTEKGNCMLILMGLLCALLHALLVDSTALRIPLSAPFY